MIILGIICYNIQSCFPAALGVASLRHLAGAPSVPRHDMSLLVVPQAPDRVLTI